KGGGRESRASFSAPALYSFPSSFSNFPARAPSVPVRPARPAQSLQMDSTSRPAWSIHSLASPIVRADARLQVEGSAHAGRRRLGGRARDRLNGEHRYALE